MDFELLALWLRRSHIAVGFLGLFAFWGAIVAKKGGRAHIIAGRVFEWCGYYVATTALIACTRYLTQMHHFAFGERPGESAVELARVEFAQFLLTLLAFLACSFLSQLRTGMRVVRTRRLPSELYRNWEAKLWLVVVPVSAVAIVAFGLYRVATGGSAVHWISVAIGSLSLTEIKKEWAFYAKPRELKMSWWYKHMECMLGCGVAFHTAAMVFSFRWLERNTGFELPGAWQLVPWVVPALVGAPATLRWIKSYRIKFGDGRPRTANTLSSASAGVE